MKLDPYAPCPGGRPQKLKFCCTDLHKELEHIGTTLEEGDAANALVLLDRLAPTHPDCACLESFRIQVLQELDRFDEAFRVATAFHDREPNNLVAIIDWAVLSASSGETREPLHALIDLVERSTAAGPVPDHVLAIFELAGIWVETESAAMSVLTTACLSHYSDQSIRSRLSELQQQALAAHQVPLTLRDHAFPIPPKSFPAGNHYDAAVKALVFFRWKTALAGLQQLREYAESFPELLWLITRIQVALFDNEAACATLDAYTALTSITEDQRFDAKLTQRYLNADPLGDGVSFIGFDYTLLEDAYPLEVIASSRRIAVVPGTENKASSHPEYPEGVAPLRQFLLLDRARPITSLVPQDGTAIPTESVPRILAFCRLFGKQTDRPTQLEVIPPAALYRSAVESGIRELFADQIVSCETIGGADGARDVASLTDQLLLSNYYFGNEQLSDEQLEEAALAYATGDFVETWIASPLGLLDGKRPCDVIGDPAFRDSLRVAVEIVKRMAGPTLGDPIAAAFRERLQVPAETPIAWDDQITPANCADVVPIWRWHRLDTDSLPSPVLETMFMQSLIYREMSLASAMAEEMVSRPADAVQFSSRQAAFEILKEVALAERNVDEALAWIERARKEERTLDPQNCHWDCVEIRLCLGLGIGTIARVNELLAFLSVHHPNHPEAQHVFQIVEYLQQQTSAAAQEAGGPSGIWTPDGPNAPAVGGSPILWTP